MYNNTPIVHIIHIECKKSRADEMFGFFVQKQYKDLEQIAEKHPRLRAFLKKRSEISSV